MKVYWLEWLKDRILDFFADPRNLIPYDMANRTTSQWDVLGNVGEGLIIFVYFMCETTSWVYCLGGCLDFLSNLFEE